jgi:predicted membrane-bound mannosyltransferase
MLSRTKVLGVIPLVDHMARLSSSVFGFLLPLTRWLIRFRVSAISGSVYLLLFVVLVPLLYGGLYGEFGS